jgi:sugar lactone lactonase YvrE
VSTSSGFSTGAAGAAPAAIAIDGSGNAWVANAGNDTIVELSPAGGTMNTVSSLNAPGSIAVDGLGNVWVGNPGASTVSAFTVSGVALAGSPFGGAGISSPTSVAVTPK